jgi:hypothetical protein
LADLLAKSILFGAKSFELRERAAASDIGGEGRLDEIGR